MKINPYIQVQQLYNNTQKAGTVRRAGSAGPRDGLVLSNLGREIQAAKQAVANAPDVREDRIAQIRAAMSSGTYDVSGERFADKLIKAAESI